MDNDSEKPFDHRSPDGSRHFAEVPDRFGNSGWETMRDRLAALPGVKVTEFLFDGVTQAITDFTYRGHEFTIDTQFGELWLFVSDPECPAEILVDVSRLVRQLPDRSR